MKGIYKVRADFDDSEWIEIEWDGGEWENEEEMIDGIIFSFSVDGNYACDCNRKVFIDRKYQREEKDYPCGNSAALTRLELTKPDKTVAVIWSEG